MLVLFCPSCAGFAGTQWPTCLQGCRSACFSKVCACVRLDAALPGVSHALVPAGPWMTMSRTLDVPLPTPVNNAELEKIVADVSLLSAPQARFVSNKDAILASPQMAMCLARVTRARSIPRIKQLIVSVKDMTVNDTDISATLQDLSGEIIGCVHRRVLEEFGKEFGVGAVLVLKKVRRVGVTAFRLCSAQCLMALCFPWGHPAGVRVFALHWLALLEHRAGVHRENLPGIHGLNPLNVVVSDV